ncbi:MAG: hypothetical protein JJU15_00010 [Pararhodobacter sp.]|nr:hypothetical protein [Pararhodobacter sp.]
MSTRETYLGLPVIDGKLVRRSDIETLPFADFWRESPVGSTVFDDERRGETFVYLHDWERFARLFIATGRHRSMPIPDSTE